MNTTRMNVSWKANQVAREERRKKVAANILGGLTYREIAEALNVSLGTVANDVKIILGRWQREQVADAEKYVQIELRRLDRAINAIWNDVQDGKLTAIDRMIKLMERRAKLMGLDAPQRHQLTGQDGDTLGVQVQVVLPDNARGDRTPDGTAD